MIGLFLHEQIPRGMSFGETIDAIKAQGGVVYVPHPFDRMHAIPDPATLHRHLDEIDVFEVYNARLLFETYNDEALRFARKYNLTMGAGSDAHVLQGVGTGALRMRAFDGPDEFLLSLRTAEILRRPSRSSTSSPSSGRPRQRNGSGRGENRNGPWLLCRPTRSTSGTSRRRSPRSTSSAPRSRRPPASAHFPVVGSGHPLADIILLKYGPQASEAQEGVSFYGRAGQAIIKSLQRLHVDPLAVYGTNCLKFAAPKRRAGAAVADARAAHRAAEAGRRDGRGHARAFSTSSTSRSRDPVEPRLGELQRFTPTIEALVVPDIDASLDEQPEKTDFGTRSRRSAPGGRSCPRTESTAPRAFAAVDGARAVLRAARRLPDASLSVGRRDHRRSSSSRRSSPPSGSLLPIRRARWLSSRRSCSRCSRSAFEVLEWQALGQVREARSGDVRRLDPPEGVRGGLVGRRSWR